MIESSFVVAMLWFLLITTGIVFMIFSLKIPAVIFFALACGVLLGSIIQSVGN